MPDGAGTLRMLTTLGIALLETGQATNVVQAQLRATAAAYGITDLRALVLPTAVIVQSGDGVAQLDQTTVLTSRLDQAGAIDRLAREALHGTADPADLTARIDTVRESKPRMGPIAMLLGTVLLTIGFGLMLNPTAAALPAYAVFGAFVGALLLLAARWPALSTLMPVLAAFLVTLVATGFLASFVGDDALRVIAPALITFFPGLTLTIAAVELTSNQVMSGSSRLVYGVAQLLLIAFGVLAASVLTGHTPTGASHDTLGWWGPLVGVVVVGVGYVLQQSAPPRALGWVLAALVVAYAAQALVATTLSAELSGFAAAVVVAPFARLASRFTSAPPPRMLMLVTYWMLVPGALGFIGVSEAAAALGTSTLMSTAISVLAIALGILVGNSITRDATRLTARLERPLKGSDRPEQG